MTADLSGRVLTSDDWTPEQAAGYVRESYARYASNLRLSHRSCNRDKAAS